MSEKIWISWTSQRRNAGIASGIGACLYTFSYEKYKLLRYPFCILSTFKTLLKERPKICCAMLPSIFCALILVFLKGIFKYKLVIDLHTLNVYYLLGKGKKKALYNRLLKYCLDKADLIIVSNDYYARSVGQPAGKLFSLPDRIADNIVCSRVNKDSSNGQRVLCICSYDPDEAYTVLFKVVSNMPSINFYFSGNYNVLKKSGKKLPDYPNIHFTGFLPADKYEEQLCLANVIVVTTELEGCLCCGAYEAFAVGKPLVLSSTDTLREYFGKGPLYTGNNAKDIEITIRIALDNQAEYAALIRARAQELKNNWNSKLSKLNIILREIISLPHDYLYRPIDRV